jgi:hypothetical protein
MRNRLTELEIEFAGIQLTVTGIFTPSESAVMYYSDMSGQPTSGAEFDIDSVQINGQNKRHT